MQLTPNYYQGRVCLNVLAGGLQNAKEVYEAAQGHVVVGVLSKDYADIASAVEGMQQYAAVVNNALSIGLGAGDPRQAPMVTQLAGLLQPQHVNQVFSAVGASRAQLGQSKTVVNGLISPSGEVGYVNIATGPLSAEYPAALVPVETAVAMLREMGGSSVKFFNMRGREHIAEYRYIADVCAEQNFMLEPTGGIDLNNFSEIVAIALEAGVQQVIPHIYSSIIDAQTGETRPQDVAALLRQVQQLLA
ncbi:MAG: 2-dehydro-3-deoxy-phosphogluconate aldolase [Enterobacteriaceae bacterium]